MKIIINGEAMEIFSGGTDGIPVKPIASVDYGELSEQEKGSETLWLVNNATGEWWSPRMTESTDGDYAVSASSQYNNNFAVKFAFDGRRRTDSYWESSGKASGTYIQFANTAQPMCFQGIRMGHYTDFTPIENTLKCMPKAFKILCSDDGINWTTIYETPSTGNPDYDYTADPFMWNTVTFEPATYKYWRIVMDSNYGGIHFDISEIEFLKVNPNGGLFLRYKEGELSSATPGTLPTMPSITLPASAWDESKQQTAIVPGVLADESAQLIHPTPAAASQSEYYAAGVLCIGQAENALTFEASTVPTQDLTVYVAIQEVK